MGLSASQARLLSITARLSDNELHSQQIANAKVRLADQTQQASADYIKALDSTKLVYTTYDANGEQSCVDLTPGLMYTYAPMKNQYAMMTADNKILVSALDAKNYEETDGLTNFLDRYGLLETVTQSEARIEHNPAYDKWLNEDHPKWESEKPDREKYPYKYWWEDPDAYTETINKWVHTDSLAYDACGKFGCFRGALHDHSNCYMHVLAALIGVGEHTTSSGETYTIYYTTTNPDTIASGWSWNSYSKYSEEIDESIREQMRSDPVYDQPYNDDLSTEMHGIVACTGTGNDAEQYNHPWDPETGTGGYCYQKAVDLLWRLHEDYSIGSMTGGSAKPEHLAEFFYFIEFDLGEGHFAEEQIEHDNSEYRYNDDKYDEDYDNWEKSEPPEPPEEIENTYYHDIIGVNDRDKAQWYTNLWYMMNGSDTANLVSSDSETYKEGKTGIYPLEQVLGAPKSAQGNYKVLEENLMSSSSWLQFALKNGVITLAKAEFFNPSEDSGKVIEPTKKGITWKSIAFSSAADIHEVDDEKAIAKAEAEYTKKLNEIEAKDKKYDSDIKKLDTEHNALKTEYESVQTVISKNVERSFKAFS